MECTMDLVQHILLDPIESFSHLQYVYYVDSRYLDLAYLE